MPYLVIALLLLAGCRAIEVKEVSSLIRATPETVDTVGKAPR